MSSQTIIDPHLHPQDRQIGHRRANEGNQAKQPSPEHLRPRPPTLLNLGHSNRKLLIEQLQPLGHIPPFISPKNPLKTREKVANRHRPVVKPGFDGRKCSTWVLFLTNPECRISWFSTLTELG
ncbi:hypothetical protein BGZ63DRAFT_424442 [Mariannaea sp. PMI_226]|nr:hypothetical protein BGZ63DRAFT_424442 [Mariannaea sp. PMI_226]